MGAAIRERTITYLGPTMVTARVGAENRVSEPPCVLLCAQAARRPSASGAANHLGPRGPSVGTGRLKT